MNQSKNAEFPIRLHIENCFVKNDEHVNKIWWANVKGVADDRLYNQKQKIQFGVSQQLPSIKCASFVWIACVRSFPYVRVRLIFIHCVMCSVCRFVVFSMWESMRLRVVYMLSMKAKRLYDKWPIKYIKAISHSFFSHQFSGALDIQFGFKRFSSDHLWISRTTRMTKQKRPQTKWRKSLFCTEYAPQSSHRNPQR